MAEPTHFDDVRVLEFSKELDLTNGRHVEAIFKLPDSNFLDSDLSPRRTFPPYIKREPPVIAQSI